jgi:hypothetical protein
MPLIRAFDCRMAAVNRCDAAFVGVIGRRYEEREKKSLLSDSRQGLII